jgi:hypothetical protein
MVSVALIKHPHVCGSAFSCYGFDCQSEPLCEWLCFNCSQKILSPTRLYKTVRSQGGRIRQLFEPFKGFSDEEPSIDKLSVTLILCAPVFPKVA